MLSPRVIKAAGAQAQGAATARRSLSKTRQTIAPNKISGSFFTATRQQQQWQHGERLVLVPHTKQCQRLPALYSRGFATAPGDKKKEDEENKQEGEPKKEQQEEVAAEEESAKKEEESSSGDSLRDSINRMKRKVKGEATADGEGSSATEEGGSDFARKAADFFDRFKKEVGEAWQELLRSGERKDINKKIIRPEATAEGEKEYTGPVDIMVIDESEHLTAWERMQKRLTEAPVIQDVLSRAEGVYEKSGAKKTKQKIDHLREDAREAWETSQNPWVYRASSVYDTLTAETAESIAVKELRVLDPDFTLDDWRRDVVGYTLPKIMEWFLQGKINQLKPWLGEGVFHRIASEITARKQEGVQIDTHVLGIMNSEILAVEVRFNCLFSIIWNVFA